MMRLSIQNSLSSITTKFCNNMLSVTPKTLTHNNRFLFSQKNQYVNIINSYVKAPIQSLVYHRFSRLCRYDKPIGAFLLYWPCAWGVAVGSLTMPTIWPFLLFLMGAWTSRSAGCIINDYLDKQFDKKVQRCKIRPLASGEVSVKQAVKLLFLNLCGGLFVLTQLPKQALIATFMILPVSALYPLAKRYTKYPQAVLGSAFNSGVIICALAMNPLNPEWYTILPLYASGICWTLIYDTIYAFQDINDDKKLGLKSTAIQWQFNIGKVTDKLLVTSFLCCFSLSYFDSKYLYCLPLFIGAHLYLKTLLNKIDIKNKQSCHLFFKKNTYYGILMLLAILCKNFANQSQKQQESSLSQSKLNETSNKDKNKKIQLST